MAFGKLESRPAPAEHREPFWPVFWATIAFCLTVPTLFGTIVEFFSIALELFMRTALNMNSGAAPSLADPWRELAARTSGEWTVRLVPAGLCALIWCLLHAGRSRVVSPWLFVLAAIVVPFLAFILTSPVWAYVFDEEARKALNSGLSMLLISVISPLAIVLSLSELAHFFVRTGTLLHASISSEPVQQAIYIYIPLVAATSFFGAAAEFYTNWRRTFTTREALGQLLRDLAAFVASPFRLAAQFGGLTDQTMRTPAQSVAYAIAAPWVIPVICTATYAIANGSHYLFPIFAILAAAIAYVSALGLWRAAEFTGLTHYRITGALLGFVIALLVAIVPFVIDAQAESLRHSPRPIRFEILASIAPVLLTLVISLFRGARGGWRVGRMEFEPRYRVPR